MRTLRINAAVLVACFTVTFVAAVTYLGGWDALSGRPIVFGGDAVFHYLYAKIVIESGWNWHLDTLGSPFGFSLISFGVNLTPEVVLLNVLRLTTNDPITLLNRAWVFCLGIAAMEAFLAFRLLRLSLLPAAIGGILFALVPYAFWRNVMHFNLNSAFIALPLAAALLVATGELARLSSRGFLVLAAACALPGFAFIYQAFFVGIVFAVAIAIALLRRQPKSAVFRGLLCLGSLCLATSVNLAPTLISWKTQGRAGNFDVKSPVEADLYSLQIRDLILPHAKSPIPGLARLGAKANAVAWPLRNENQSAKLGLIGALGFVLSLFVLTRLWSPIGPQHLDTAIAASTMILALVLISVSGGFGSLFNLYFVPEFRCYNRVAPLIEFFSLFVLFAAFTHWLSRQGARRRAWTPVFLFILLFGLVDQNVAADLRENSQNLQNQATELKAFVKRVEATVPANASLFMLPITTFPRDENRNHMEVYDHGKPSLFTRKLRWSWPHFGPRHESLVETVGNPQTDPAFVDRVRSFGFTHLWIDRYGPTAEVEAIVRNVSAQGAAQLLSSETDHYRVYALGAKEGPVDQPVLLRHGSGFYQQETYSDGRHFRWSQSESALNLTNTLQKPRWVRLTFSIVGMENGRTVGFTVNGAVHTFPLTTMLSEHGVEFAMQPQETLELRLRTDALTDTTTDARDLRFMLFEPRTVDAGGPRASSSEFPQKSAP